VRQFIRERILILHNHTNIPSQDHGQSSFDPDISSGDQFSRLEAELILEIIGFSIDNSDRYSDDQRPESRIQNNAQERQTLPL